MFAENKVEPETRDDARKRQIGSDDAWELIRRYKTVLIGKGKKTVEYSPAESNKEEILKAALGRSGNLRAPAIVSDGRLIIGYNDSLYKETL